MIKKGMFALCAAGIMMVAASCEKQEEARDLITFEELEAGDSGYWNGSDSKGGFFSGNAYFPNHFTDWGGGITSWSGFAYSMLGDKTTAGYSNQYSSFSGGGSDNSKMFALITLGDTLEFSLPELVDRISVTNCTYTALSMKDGDNFAKKFGGMDGMDPDFFHLIITGIDEVGRTTGTVTFVLADYSSDDPSKDFIAGAWTDFSLESLGSVKKLAFRFDSSDKGDWGINTPQYACIDNIEGLLQ